MGDRGYGEQKLTRAMLTELAAFFPERAISWKPQSVRGAEALAVAYIDARDVQHRLDDVVGGDWSFQWEVVTPKEVKGKLTICGVLREDVGEMGDSDQGQTLKAAVSDALKRAAVQFGVGRYLYYLPLQWVAWNGKGFVNEPRLPRWAIPSDDPEPEIKGPVTEEESDTQPATSAELPLDAPTGKADSKATVAWQGAFFGWCKKVLERNGIGATASEAYAWMKNEGHMNDHLAEYATMGDAQREFLAGVTAFGEFLAKEAV